MVRIRTFHLFTVFALSESATVTTPNEFKSHAFHRNEHFLQCACNYAANDDETHTHNERVNKIPTNICRGNILFQKKRKKRQKTKNFRYLCD